MPDMVLTTLIQMSFLGFLLSAIALLVSFAKDDSKGALYYISMFLSFMILTLTFATTQDTRVQKKTHKN